MLAIFRLRSYPDPLSPSKIFFFLELALERWRSSDAKKKFFSDPLHENVKIPTLDNGKVSFLSSMKTKSEKHAVRNQIGVIRNPLLKKLGNEVG